VTHLSKVQYLILSASMMNAASHMKPCSWIFRLQANDYCINMSTWNTLDHSHLGYTTIKPRTTLHIFSNWLSSTSSRTAGLPCALGHDPFKVRRHYPYNGARAALSITPTVPSFLLYVFPVSAGLFPFRLCASADDVETTYYLIERASVQTVTTRVGGRLERMYIIRRPMMHPWIGSGPSSFE